MSVGKAPASASGGRLRYRMILFVAGDERNSRLARENLARLRENDLQGRCEVQIVDVLKNFAAAMEHQVLLTLCLLWVEPPPGARISGNLSDLKPAYSALHLDHG